MHTHVRFKEEKFGALNTTNIFARVAKILYRSSSRQWNNWKSRMKLLKSTIFFFLSQLQALGVSSKTLEWLHSYVIVLFQRVHMQDTNSLS